MLENKVLCLGELFKIERAKKNIIYPKNSILIQVSATKGEVGFLSKNDMAHDKNVVLILKDPSRYNAKYLYHIINEHLKENIDKYRAGLNIQFEEIEKIKIKIHTKKETQDFFEKMLNDLDEVAEKEHKQVENLRKYKNYMLDKMFFKKNKKKV